MTILRTCRLLGVFLLIAGINSPKLFSQAGPTVSGSEKVGEPAIAGPSGNRAPVANAGPGQTVAAGALVTLNGSGSTDADGSSLRFAWTMTRRPAGSAVTLNDPTAVMPTFVADVPGLYVARLTVNDGLADSAPATVSISTTNSAPVASAGPDQTVGVGATVTLNGSGSSDVDGNPLTFAWRLTSRPAGSLAILANSAGVAPTFVADRPGTYVVRLIVNDGIENGAVDTVTISTENSSPVTDAGADQTAAIGASVALNGGGSTDADGDSLTFSWSFVARPAGSAAILRDPAAIVPTFVADVRGTYVVQLIVHDGTQAGAADTVRVRTSNSAPVSKAGRGQTVAIGSVALLDGSGSSDPDGDPLTYNWALTSVPAGSSATLSGANTAGPSFVLDRAGAYVVQLIVNDGLGNGAPDTVTIITSNSPPAADAGPDQPASVDSVVTLFGGLSSDADGDPLTYAWSITSRPAGSTAALHGPGTDSPTFTPDVAGEYLIQLTVNDGFASSRPDTVLVRTPDASGGPVVTIAATDSSASTAGADPATFTIARSGPTTSALTVTFTREGSAMEGVHYQGIGTSVVIPAGAASTALTATPIRRSIVRGTETITLRLTRDEKYNLGPEETRVATVTITESAEVGGPLTNGGLHTGAIAAAGAVDTWTFAALAGDRIGVKIGEIVDNNDFRPWIRLIAPGGAVLSSTSGTDAAEIDGVLATATGTYSVSVASFDSGFDGTGTYRLTMTHTPGPITVSPGDQGGPLTSGAMHDGTMLQGDLDVWTITATAGDRIAVHIGEITDTDDFRPWIRLWAPNGAVLGSTSNVSAAAIDGVLAPVSGTYLVLVSSFDSGLDGTGTYRLAMTLSSGPNTVSPGDQGGALTNGAIHTGQIVTGDLDVWTFTATAGQRLGVHIGEIVDSRDFRPWIRLWAPNGAILGSTSGTDAAAIDGVVAPVAGTYRVLVATFDSGLDGTGTYRLMLAKTGAPVTVSEGDQGGPLTNGAMHVGEILQGDVDVWTFTAAAGERIGIHVGETTQTDDFRPWIRLWAPNGAVLGSTSNVAAAAIDGVVAPVSGTYLVLVGSFDSGLDGTGTYRLTSVHTAGANTVSEGDEGGALTVGAIFTGQIVTGDVDVWTFTATAGERLGVHVGEITDNNDLRPWIRLWAPNGATLGSTSGTDAAAIDGVVAPVAGTYRVLVATFDSGLDATGTYRLTLAKTRGAVSVSAGDQGGRLLNGATHVGEIVQGDVDLWTFTAAVGDRIGIHVGEDTDTDDFRPWIRLWAPNGAVLGSTSNVGAAAINAVLAPVAGSYLILVSSFDSGLDGTGTYRLTMTHTPGPITVSAGDEGGVLANGAMRTGLIMKGDVDVWQFTATAGDRLGINIGEITETDDFRPWIRLWAPNGAVLGSTSGTDEAVINGVAAPVTGTYLLLVSSFDSGLDGVGTYRLSLARTPGPITVTAGDQGGPLTSGVTRSGEILQGDLDVFTFSATAGSRLTLHLTQTSEFDDFRPWIRLWAPNGAILASASGLDAAAAGPLTAPVTGTYLVLVGTFDAGFDGTGTYDLTVSAGN
jgi:hypothetical protein